MFVKNCFYILLHFTSQLLLYSQTTHNFWTAGHWKCVNTEEEGWKYDAFDDSHWPWAVDDQAFGYGSNSYRNNFDTSAKFIWATNLNNNNAYCRGRLCTCKTMHIILQTVTFHTIS